MHLAEWLKATSEIDCHPASVAEVAALERRYGVLLPEDFRTYLLEALPACGGNMDDAMTTWWEIDLIKNIPDEYANSQYGPHQWRNAEVAAEQDVYLFFADYCIWCAAWAINCGKGVNRGRIVLIDGVKDDFVADSFSEFVGFHLDNAHWPRSPLIESLNAATCSLVASSTPLRLHSFSSWSKYPPSQRRQWTSLRMKAPPTATISSGVAWKCVVIETVDELTIALRRNITRGGAWSAMAASKG